MSWRCSPSAPTWTPAPTRPARSSSPSSPSTRQASMNPRRSKISSSFWGWRWSWRSWSSLMFTSLCLTEPAQGSTDPSLPWTGSVRECSVEFWIRMGMRRMRRTGLKNSMKNTDWLIPSWFKLKKVNTKAAPEKGQNGKSEWVLKVTFPKLIFSRVWPWTG